MFSYSKWDLLIAQLTTNVPNIRERQACHTGLCYERGVGSALDLLVGWRFYLSDVYAFGSEIFSGRCMNEAYFIRPCDLHESSTSLHNVMTTTHERLTTRRFICVKLDPNAKSSSDSVNDRLAAVTHYKIWIALAWRVVLELYRIRLSMRS